jgi:N-acetylmuramic acid 6-phosphate etherase
MTTEDSNPRTADLDTLPTAEILRRINAEDATVAGAVAKELPAIAAVVERVVKALDRGGRLIYAGAGTSGRLALLDAAECPPTYGTDPSRVQGLLAGGPMAMTTSVEAAEDDEAQGAREIDALGAGVDDVVVGVAASGRTPYVVGALRRARSRGACAVALVGNSDGPVAAVAELVIAPRTGPEAVTGSTRMKAGTAQKMVLNMISTAAMVRTGHTYGNLMVDVQASNSKLRDRARRIVVQATGASPDEAAKALSAAGGHAKTAIVMLRAGVGAQEARARLEQAGGWVRQAIE